MKGGETVGCIMTMGCVVRLPCSDRGGKWWHSSMADRQQQHGGLHRLTADWTGAVMADGLDINDER